MAFKGFAKAGNFSSYAIDLPIAEEINEDLRVAGDKVRDIQLVAQRKAGHAEAYTNAMHNKFRVEQENRDTNNQFFQENFKRIYEGEQREFEGRMAELKREQAEAAQKAAEPSTLEKALPHILSLVKIGAGMMAETAAAEQAAKVAQGDAFIQQGKAAGFDMGGLLKVPEGFTEGSPELRNFTQGLGEAVHYASGGTKEGLEASIAGANAALSRSPEMQTIRHRYALGSAARNAEYAVADWMNGAGNPATYGTNAKRWRADANKLYNETKISHLGTGNLSAGHAYLKTVGIETQLGAYEAQGKFINEQVRNTLPVFGKIAAEKYQGTVVAGVAAATQGLGPYRDMGKTESLYHLWQTMQNKDFITAPKAERGFLAMDAILTAAENDANLSSSDIQNLANHINQNKPGYRPGQKPTRIETRLKEAMAAKVKQEQLAIRQHNSNYAARVTMQSNEIDATVARLTAAEGPGGVQAYLKGLNEDKEALPPQIQKKVNLLMSGTQQKTKSYVQKEGLGPETKAQVKTQLQRLLNAGTNPGKVADEPVLVGIITEAAYEYLNSDSFIKKFEGLGRTKLIHNAVSQAIEDNISEKGGITIGPEGDKPTGRTKSNIGHGDGLFEPARNISQFSAGYQHGSGEFYAFEPTDPGTYESLSRTLTRVKQNREIAPQDLTHMYELPQVKLAHQATGLPMTQIIEDQGKAWAKATGNTWPGLGEVEVTNADLRQYEALGRQFSRAMTGGSSSAAINLQTSGGQYTLAPHALSTSFPVTGTFKEPRGYGREHAGLDLGTPQGTPILAKTGGVVKDAGFTGTGAGGEIFIDNGNGYDSRHLHMNRIVVQPGQRIEPGQVLGYTGGAVGTKGAGHSTGPHLHTEIRLNGQLLNPKQYIDQFFGYGVKK